MKQEWNKPTVNEVAPRVMCGCLDTLHDDLLNWKIKGRAVTNVEINQVMVKRGGALLSFASVPVRMVLKGSKNTGIIQMACAYCPFCGTKYPDEK